MIDDIGLGSALANIIYSFVFVTAILGVMLFFTFKKKSFAIWWVSLGANIFAFLYLLDNFSVPAYYAMLFLSFFVWPIINIIWVIRLIIQDRKKEINSSSNKAGKHSIKKSFLIIIGMIIVIFLIFLAGTYFFIIRWFIDGAH